jgi:CRISPR-associated protein Cas2
MTLIVIAYDVNTEDAAGRRRLRRVARACENYGQRVQNSVFECWVDSAQWTKLRVTLLTEFEARTDSLRFYFLGDQWRGRVEHHGTKIIPDPQGPLIA